MASPLGNLTALGPLRELLEEPRLERMARFNDDKERIAALTIARVLDAKRAATSGPRAFELVLNEACYLEEQRFRAQRGLDDEDKQLRGRLARLSRQLRHLTEAQLVNEAESLVRTYTEDILGNFNPAVYAFSSRMAPVILSLLLSPISPSSLSRSLTDLSQLRERVLIEGRIADLSRLAKNGTLIVVPTHLSNLDSIAIGFALERTGLPPVTYGAGKNLFTNPLLSFFMRNLGAYRVDRRIKADLYKETLKEYSAVLLERGYHSLFFPGGTRSRSGGLESRLKLGLLGTAVEATVGLLQRRESRPIYIVPTTINYTLVLEAATLIEDWLKERGQHRYIIDDDESTQLGRVARYLADTVRGGHSVTIQFGEPLDVLGHPVSDTGVSYDDRGRAVDLRPYFTRDGEVVHDDARDAEYTRELAERIVAAYRKDTHVLATHLVAFVLFRALARRARSEDLFRIIRGGDEPEPIPEEEVLASIGRMMDVLGRMAVERRLRLGAPIAGAPPQRLLDDALHFFSLFHTRPVARRAEGGILVEDRSLCCYYQNRLVGYGLEAVP
jgi:glycerol-3-phosphate O-acyltransferase